jgi:hypothetical protein
MSTDQIEQSLAKHAGEVVRVVNEAWYNHTESERVQIWIKGVLHMEEHTNGPRFSILDMDGSPCLTFSGKSVVSLLPSVEHPHLRVVLA